MVDLRKRVRRQLEVIVLHGDARALTYCVDYAAHGIDMIDSNCSDEDLLIQLLYVWTNMSGWRGDQAKVARGVIKDAIGALS